MISLIKLQNGTEVVGEVFNQTNTHIQVKDPLQINYKLVTSQPMPVVSISRYMPFAKDNMFEFSRTELLHIVEPKEAMCSYYTSAVQNYKNVVDATINRELEQAADVYQNDTVQKLSSDDLDDDALRQALIERLTHKGPLN